MSSIDITTIPSTIALLPVYFITDERYLYKPFRRNSDGAVDNFFICMPKVFSSIKTTRKARQMQFFSQENNMRLVFIALDLETSLSSNVKRKPWLLNG